MCIMHGHGLTKLIVETNVTSLSYTGYFTCRKCFNVWTNQTFEIALLPVQGVHDYQINF